MTRAELPDVNVLLALVQVDHVGHALASAWFDGVDAFVTTPLTEMGLVRLTLNPRVMGQRVAQSIALASLRSLRDHPRARFLADDASLGTSSLDLRGLQGHRQVTDFHLVDLVARHDLTLVTFDRSLPSALLSADRKRVRLLG